MKTQPISWSKLRERGGGLLFALLFELLLVLALLTLAPDLPPEKVQDRLPVSFDMADGAKAEKQAQAQKSEKREDRKAVAEAQQAPVVRPPEEEVKPTEQLPSPFPFLTLTREQMASADIGKLAKKDGRAAGQGDSKAVSGPGEGPGGVQLYPAEWYRRPTDAELSAYLPANAPPVGWGEVACKTVERYHVENCQQMGESPAGSGYARAVRLAAWQFLVLPPRINGKPQVGTWVRIRIDYTRTVIEGPGE
ncbi:MAG: hypothetical protein ABW039_14730 [Sphingobium sp.]